ncbi:acyltransferase domain-containing protein [Corallococcus sp. CA053C]|uniref:type I polyketide synthase n=1 Tax=Corallococcus sp. CA053C TaxID=2316732 RepID=UPI000EA08C32|nr:type I polyketide synthase [Corallococcus sp. CA053C]RKH14639.1 acyltransferase domain-containing protein [Corallococcus sp. CA053C]
MSADTNIDAQAIAIVGMAGRFPGAPDLDTFWRNLREGVESIHPVPDAELEKLGVDPVLRKDPRHVKASAALEGMELFDAGFFGFTPREAELMDPQHRVFLECAWEALEKAGHTPEGFDGSIGVFAGASTNTYLVFHLVPNFDQLSGMDQVQVDVSNGGDFLATRVAYKLNLRGPSYSITSACSTSLVATHAACQSLLNEECDVALAGGVSVHVKHPEGYPYVPGGIVSPDGHCRAFDAKAEGTVFGSGVGVVVLKRLADALADGDHIHAIIKGSAINNDGAMKVGFTAPSVEGQATVISEALGAAGVAPESIGYLEAHGTGTKMGDPIEVRALNKAFKFRSAAAKANPPKIPVGSLKSNIGHLANAAGVSSLIKAVLTLEHRQIPPSLHVTEVNPEIPFAGGPFFVNTKLTDWQANPKHPRRAGVSSFGVGGTNAHVVLEEAPTLPPSGASRPAQLVVLSAKSDAALDAATRNLAAHLKAHPEQALADVAFTLQTGRQAMAKRRVLICRDRDDALAALEVEGSPRLWTQAPDVQERPVAFLFPGQGSQYVGMARDLYASEPTFKKHLDACAEKLTPHLGLDLRTVLFPEASKAEAATQALSRTELTQPALFVVEYALAKLWMAWGVKPSAMMGHSIGEYVAACLAGVFSLEDALALVAARGKLMQGLPAGAMLSARLEESALKPLLTGGLAVAAVNAPGFTVVAGPTDAVDALQAKLEAQGVEVSRLHTSHAFHSAMMDPILAPFTERVRQVKLNAPTLPFLSNVTGTWIEAGQATDPGYWATHLRQAVRFSAGLQELGRKWPQAAFLEVGPGTVLATLAKQQPGAEGRVLVSTTRHPREQTPDLPVLLGALGRLWLGGVSVDWKGFAGHEQRRRVPLPTYPFQRERYWIEAKPLGTAGSARTDAPASLTKRADVADWFYAPSWKLAPLPRAKAQDAQEGGWLVFADDTGVADALAPKLGGTVYRVVPGTKFEQRPDGTYTVDPKHLQDYCSLMDALKKQGRAFANVVHLWSLSREPASQATTLELGFHSQLFLARALGEAGHLEPLTWSVVTSRSARVEQSDARLPEQALLVGPTRVLPQEYPHLACRFVDVVPGDAGAVADRLAAELRAEVRDAVVALRGRQRWVQTFEPVRLEAGADVLRDGGVYLITDGLTGIGHALASELATVHHAKLTLVETTDFPSRGQWAAWVEKHGVDDAVSRRIQRAQALERTGVELLVVPAALTDVESMRGVVDTTTARFGRIDGVIHAAGGMQGATLGTIAETGPDKVDWHFRPQVHGVRVLQQVLPAEGPAFCLLVSSLSSVLGGLGQVAQASASAFMDAFAEGLSETSAYPWLSVDWDAWQFEDDRAMAELSPALARFAIQPAEGLEALHRALAHGEGGRLAVSTGDLTARRRQGPRPTKADAKGKQDASRGKHARPSILTPYLAPRTELEKTVAGIWEQVLGIDGIGIHDNFFELGGHSLLATQLRNHIHAVLKVDLSLRGLFETPTVAGVAGRVEQELGKRSTATEKPIAERLRTAFPTERPALLTEYLRHHISEGLRIPLEQLPADGSLKGYDLHALGAELEYDLRQDFKFQLYPHEVQAHPSIPELSKYLLVEMDRLTDPQRFAEGKPLSDYPLKPYRAQGTGKARTNTAKKNPPMVFVHSSPRAGSTLFRVMLAGHPRLFCPPEVNLLFFESMREWRENIGFGSEMEWTTGGLQWAFMELEKLDSAAGAGLVDRLVADDVSAQEVYRRLQEKSAPRLLVDKTPTYAMDVETLQRAEQMFDGNKYIYLYRHPLPVMESILRMRFDRLFAAGLFGDADVDPYVVAETVWALSNRNLLNFFDGIGRERCHWVAYEDLVADPTKVMTGVCDFLGLSFDERMVQPYDGKKDRMMGGLGDPNILQHQGIEKKLGESWKRIKWPRAFDASTHAVIERLGYSVEGATPAAVPAAATLSAPAPKQKLTPAEAEKLLENMDQLSDEQVAELLAVMEDAGGAGGGGGSSDEEAA